MVEATSTALTDEIRWDLLQVKAHAQRAARAFALFREHEIEPILIKGIAAGQWYPELQPRSATDTDLAVSRADFETAQNLATSDDASGLAIDLHRELRHLDTVPWDDLFANSQLVDIAGEQIRVLRPEDHLRVLCVHWLNDGAEYKERLWDIYYAVENRPDNFDWDRFLSVVSPTRRRWLVCAIGLAHRYLDLNIDDTPIKEEALDLPEWLPRAAERAWADPVRLLPIHIVLGKPSMLLSQIRKRLRPNPIMATVELEGSFDARSRVPYQIRDFLKRTLPMYRRVTGQEG